MLGWVDLWRGVLLCNVCDGERALRYIQFPNPLDGNMHKHLMSSPREVRDVTFTNGFIGLIKIEERTIIPVAPDMPSRSNDPRNGAAAASLELENTMATCTTESYAPDAAGLPSHGLERLPRIVGARAARPMLIWKLHLAGVEAEPHSGLALEDLVVVCLM